LLLYSSHHPFKEIFLGTTNNAKETKIVNPNVIGFDGEVFEFKKDKSYAKAIPFEAFASKPIEILNNALGYKISVSLTKFSATPRSFEILMYTHFDTLPATDAAERIRWHRNRIDTYYGSQTHLFRSIKRGRYLEEGFRIYEGNEKDVESYQTSILYAKAKVNEQFYVQLNCAPSPVHLKGPFKIMCEFQPSLSFQSTGACNQQTRTNKYVPFLMK
jgi:hypothetical protein